MWDFFETVRHRHSVRSYQSDLSVEKENLIGLEFRRVLFRSALGSGAGYHS